MTEPWIRVHANLADKPVVCRAVETLGVRHHEAIGLLVQFWGAVSQHATDGAVAALSDAQIEVWAGWTRKRGKFASFIRSTHLDCDGRVNEWDCYAGALEEQRRQSRNRKRTSRGRHSDGHSDSHADGHGDIAVTSSPTKRNDNETKRNELEVVDLAIPPDSELTALFLTICANRAITERWGEQPSPLARSSAVQLADELAGEGISAAVARLSIYRQCRETKIPKPPRTVSYFGNGIRGDWEKEQTRVAIAASGERPPLAAPAIRPVGGGLESFKERGERKEQAEAERKHTLVVVDTRRARTDDGDIWWLRMQRDSGLAGLALYDYALRRVSEPAEMAHAG